MGDGKERSQQGRQQQVLALWEAANRKTSHQDELVWEEAFGMKQGDQLRPESETNTGVPQGPRSGAS